MVHLILYTRDFEQQFIIALSGVYATETKLLGLILSFISIFIY